MSAAKIPALAAAFELIELYGINDPTIRHPTRGWIDISVYEREGN
jgi:hypothetical protein